MRIAFVTLCLASIIVHAMYCASLTSCLAVDKATPPYNDLRELYLHSSHRVVTVAGTSYVEMLKTGNTIDRKIYAERLILESTVNEAFQKTLDGNTAFLWTEPALNKIIGKNCSHSKISRRFFELPYSWAVRKDFPYTGYIRFS